MPDGGAPSGIDAIEGRAYSCHGSASHEMPYDDVYLGSSHNFHERGRHVRSVEAECRLGEQPGSYGGVGAGLGLVQVRGDAEQRTDVCHSRNEE